MFGSGLMQNPFVGYNVALSHFLENHNRLHRQEESAAELRSLETSTAVADAGSDSTGSSPRSSSTPPVCYPKPFTIDAILGKSPSPITNVIDYSHPAKRNYEDDEKEVDTEKSGNGKSKRVRTIFSPEQLERLEAEFERQQYMVGPERLYLAHTLNLTEAQVKVWFQNRRIKWRKQHLEMTQHRLALLKHHRQERMMRQHHAPPPPIIQHPENYMDHHHRHRSH